MASALLLMALSLTACLGFALLAVSQARHWRTVSGTAGPSPIATILLRVLGSGCLLSALGLALIRDGPSFGALLWATAISLAALAVAFTLSWQPRLLRPLAGAGRAVARTKSSE